MKAALFLLAFLLFPAHDFHLSLTEIGHNAEKKTLEISIKLFADDLTDGLEQFGAPEKLNLGIEAELPEANEHIEAYLKRHFQLKMNGKQTSFVYLGKEAEMDAIWCFVEVRNVSKVNSLEVQNTLLLETFEDQTNMVNLNINGRKKSGLARKGNSKLTFEF